MKKTVIVFLIVLVITGCEKNKNICGCNNPLEELSWLKDLKNSMNDCFCETSVFQATYKKQTVFYTSMTDIRCEWVINIGIRDCNGNVLKTYTAIDDVFNSEVTDRKIIYTCATD